MIRNRERDDVERLFVCLETLYPGKPMSRHKANLSIWDTVLKPWTYEQVRDVVVQRARKNRFRPDVSELAVLLPDEEVVEEVPEPSLWDKPDADTLQAVRAMQARGEALQAMCGAMGIPTPSQWQAQGGIYRDYCEMGKRKKPPTQ